MVNITGIYTTRSKSLQQQLFIAQLEVVQSIRTNPESNQEDSDFADLYSNELHKKILNLDENRFEVRKNWEFVMKYKNEQSWEQLTNTSIIEIENHLSHLVSYTEDKDELAKKFDLVIYQLQFAILNASQRQNILIQNIRRVGELLHKKINITVVKAKENTINAVVSGEFWSSINLKKLEKIREDLRGLIHLLKDEDKEPIVYSNFKDDLNVNFVKERNLLENYTSLQSYKDRVENFIRKNKHHLVIDKIYKNIPISETDLKSLEEFFTYEKFYTEEIEKEYGTKSLGVFVRKVLGLDIEAANHHFASFIQEENLNANQILFVQKIVDYLNKNGVLEKHMLTQPPFTDIDDQGIFGVFDENQKSARIIKLVEDIYHSAEIA